MSYRNTQVRGILIYKQIKSAEYPLFFFFFLKARLYTQYAFQKLQ